MQETDNAILSELSIAEWLEAYQHISAPAEGKRGPIRPGPGKSCDIVPGPYPNGIHLKVHGNTTSGTGRNQPRA